MQPFSPLPCALKSSLKAISARKNTRSESIDDHPAIVAMLDTRTRVVECSTGIQWIIQRRENGGRYPWQNVYFCRTKAGLLLYAPKPTASVLLALPDRFPKRQNNSNDQVGSGKPSRDISKAAPGFGGTK